VTLRLPVITTLDPHGLIELKVLHIRQSRRCKRCLRSERVWKANRRDMPGLSSMVLSRREEPSVARPPPVIFTI
jgi:hypothetical protein